MVSPYRRPEFGEVIAPLNKRKMEAVPRTFPPISRDFRFLRQPRFFKALPKRQVFLQSADKTKKRR